ncbi:MAG: hypothetical protein Kow0060_12080 [Methylohalobius crimeensis]
MSIRHRTLPLLGFSLIAAAASPIGADTLGFHLRALKREFADYRSSQATLPPERREPFKSRSPGLRLWDDKVLVTATLRGDATAVEADLRRLGMVNLSRYEDIVSGWMPLDRLGSLETIPGISHVRISTPANQAKNNRTALRASLGNAVVSQGDSAMQADRARKKYRVDGSGITVGVLSDSYDCLGEAGTDVLAGELPEGVEVLQEVSDCTTGADEGRAMMQLIHDVAPGARLLFHIAFGGEADFANGIVRLAEAGADVIVDDVGYASEPMFQDGLIAQAVNRVHSQGVAYFSSAGNSGRLGYETPFNPARVNLTGDIAHNFSPIPNAYDFYQAIEIPKEAEVGIILQWNDPFETGGGPGADSDLDIFLFNQDLTRVVASSEDDNIGHDPLERLNFVNENPENEDSESGTRFNLYISHRAGPPPERIKHVIWKTSPPQWPEERGFVPDQCALQNGFGGIGAGQPSDPETPAVRILEYADSNGNGTIFGHPNAAGAMAVAAIPYRETPWFGMCTELARIEHFSSAGGLPIYFDTEGNPLDDAPLIRRKPDITAPDGGNTTFFGEDTDQDELPNFSGTSAAAPHAAAVAALMREYNPFLTPDALYDAMRNSALDLDDPSTLDRFDQGFDFGTGYGLLDAPGAFLATEFDGLHMTLAPVPTGASPGDVLYYPLTVRNFSGIAANDVAIQGTLPAGTAVAGLEGCPAVDTAASACLLGDLEPGDRREVTLHLKIVDGKVGVIAPAFQLSTTSENLAPYGGGRLQTDTRIVHPTGDFNADGCVDLGDRAVLLTVIRGGLTDPQDLARYDLTDDGQLNQDDLRELVRLYSRPDGAPCV